MRLPFIRAIALFLFVATLPVSASDWLLTAVPQAAGKDGQILNISKPFQVILTNATSHNLVVWKDWCSWGYFNLSFEFKGKDGKIIKVEKNPLVGWTRNGPAEFVVQPGCAYLLTVDFLGSKEWTNVQALQGAMTMKVMYKNTNKVPEDMQKKLNSVWIGQVRSDPMPVTIVR